MEKRRTLFSSEETKAEYYSAYDSALERIPVAHDTMTVATGFGYTHVIHCGCKDHPKLVLLHCMGFSSTCWYSNLEALSRRFDVYCVDEIGQPGKTECSRAKIGEEDFSQWLNEVLDALKLDKVNMAGWSMGGFHATGFVMRHPERVGKAAALSPAGTVSPVTSAFYLKLIPILITGKEKYINRFLKWISGSDNTDSPNPAFSVFIAGMKCFRGWAGMKIAVYPDEAFRSLSVPFLVLLGARDPVYRKGIVSRVIEKLNRINPMITAEAVDGTHGFPIQQAEMTNNRLISFFLDA